MTRVSHTTVDGIAPALRGGATTVDGIAPALRGGATTVDGIAPALRGGATTTQRCTRMPWAHPIAGLSLGLVCAVSFAKGAPD